jgi:hypothetical protein
VEIHTNHFIFGRGFETVVRFCCVNRLKADEFVLIERGEIFAFGSAEITAGALDPEYFGLLASEGIGLHDFGGSVAATGVGDALVGSENVGAVDEAGYGIEFSGMGVVP